MTCCCGAALTGCWGRRWRWRWRWRWRHDRCDRRRRRTLLGRKRRIPGGGDDLRCHRLLGQPAAQAIGDAVDPGVGDGELIAQPESQRRRALAVGLVGGGDHGEAGRRHMLGKPTRAAARCVGRAKDVEQHQAGTIRRAPEAVDHALDEDALAKEVVIAGEHGRNRQQEGAIVELGCVTAIIHDCGRRRRCRDAARQQADGRIELAAPQVIALHDLKALGAQAVARHRSGGRATRHSGKVCVLTVGDDEGDA